MRDMNCQEVKKPADRYHAEGMDGRGLGMACEKSREGGEKMENICSVYLLISRMHDHNPPAVPQAFSAFVYLSVPLPLRVSSFIIACVSFPLALSFPRPHLPSVILQHGESGIRSNVLILEGWVQVVLARYTAV